MSRGAALLLCVSPAPLAEWQTARLGRTWLRAGFLPRRIAEASLSLGLLDSALDGRVGCSSLLEVCTTLEKPQGDPQRRQYLLEQGGLGHSSFEQSGNRATGESYFQGPLLRQATNIRIEIQGP